MPLSSLRSSSETGGEMRRQVRALTGIPVSVGFGETKTLAKLAVEIAKKSSKADCVLDLTGSPYQAEALSRVPVADVWGVGPRYREMLERNDIKTALDLRDADDEWIRKRMTVVSARIVQELRAVQCIPFVATPKSDSTLELLPLALKELNQVHREGFQIR